MKVDRLVFVEKLLPKSECHMDALRNVWLRQADFVDRNNFADFLNRTHRVTSGMEIGVHRGEFTKLLIHGWKGNLLHLVDPWNNPPGYESQAPMLSGGGLDRDADFEFCKKQLYYCADRVKYHRMLSNDPLLDAAIAPCSLDFAYIDGDHRYEHVLHDLRFSWSKVRRGGVIAGHDILDHPPDTISKGIQRALFEFCEEHLVDRIFLITETLCLPWSFYIVRH